MDSPGLLQAKGQAEWRENRPQEPLWRSAPVWPTNTIRICQSASHTFTVLSREAVTMASTSLKYARSEMVLEVGWGEAQRTQHRLCEQACTPAITSSPSQTRPMAPVPEPLSRFVQIPAHIDDSPALQIKGEHR